MEFGHAKLVFTERHDITAFRTLQCLWSGGKRRGGPRARVSCPPGCSLTCVGVEVNYCPTRNSVALYMLGTTTFFFVLVFPACHSTTKELEELKFK